MGRIGSLMISTLATAGLCLMNAGLDMDRAPEPGRMSDVQIIAPVTQIPAAPDYSGLSLPAMESGEPESFTSLPAEPVLETSIEGGLSVKNETGYEIYPHELLAQGPDISLSAAQPHILIIHTHASEAYTQAGLDRYDASDSCRTEDTQFNVVRIGDELAEILEGYGLNVLHDRGIYDYPSYTGSYSRSALAVEQYLDSYPEIQIVLDIHRDALGAGGVVYKTMAEEEGLCASQIMLLCGSDDSGLEHPHWRENLKLALFMQQSVIEKHPTLMRPVSLVRERYNQQLTRGSLIVEVGSSGNTLQEALAAIRLFGHSMGPALAELVEVP